MYDADDDRWVADFPVVVTFEDGDQVEVGWQKLDELALTWNTLTVDDRPMGSGDWALRWRPITLPEFSVEKIHRQPVTAVYSTAFLFRTKTTEPAATFSDGAWMTAGLWLATEGGGIHVFNALDENGVAHRPMIDDQNRVIPLPSPPRIDD